MATKEEILASIAALTVLELSELLKDFEEQTSDWLWEVNADLRYRRPSARFAQALGRPAAAGSRIGASSA